MPCCDTGAYPRTSRLGTRHFVHSRGGHCGTEGESVEHLAAKAEIVRVCHELGWTAVPEYQGDNWRADVYSTRGRHRLAFEIQWSNQTLEETRLRHAAYGDVKCCWLFRKLPIQKTSARGGPIDLTLIKNARDVLKALHSVPSEQERVPMFVLSRTDSAFAVTVDSRRVSLRDFVKARLEGRIRFCDTRHYISREVQLIVFREKCPRHWDYDVFYTRHVLQS